MEKLDIIKSVCGDKTNINYTFEDDVLIFIHPNENELHTINIQKVGSTLIHNLDSYLDFMPDDEFSKFTNYCKTL